MIADHIPTGKANAITRGELCLATGLTDRLVRKMIAEERMSGAPIISSSHSAGY